MVINAKLIFVKVKRIRIRSLERTLCSISFESLGDGDVANTSAGGLTSNASNARKHSYEVIGRRQSLQQKKEKKNPKPKHKKSSSNNDTMSTQKHITYICGSYVQVASLPFGYLRGLLYFRRWHYQSEVGARLLCSTLVASRWEEDGDLCHLLQGAEGAFAGVCQIEEAVLLKESKSAVLLAQISWQIMHIIATNLVLILVVDVKHEC
jgi:hypothetical protein